MMMMLLEAQSHVFELGNGILTSSQDCHKPRIQPSSSSTTTRRNSRNNQFRCGKYTRSVSPLSHIASRIKLKCRRLLASPKTGRRTPIPVKTSLAGGLCCSSSVRLLSSVFEACTKVSLLQPQPLFTSHFFLAQSQSSSSNLIPKAGITPSPCNPHTCIL